jgi:hypothetical protein
MDAGSRVDGSKAAGHGLRRLSIEQHRVFDQNQEIVRRR